MYVGKACGRECYQNKAHARGDNQILVTPLSKGLTTIMTCQRFAKAFHHTKKSITSLYKMYVILKAKMDKGPFIKKLLTCCERLENLVK
jgi:hypothetical protein